MKSIYALLLAGAVALPTSASATETINLTIASSHPLVVRGWG